MKNTQGALEGRRARRSAPCPAEAGASEAHPWDLQVPVHLPDGERGNSPGHSGSMLSHTRCSVRVPLGQASLILPILALLGQGQAGVTVLQPLCPAATWGQLFRLRSSYLLDPSLSSALPSS